MMKIPYKVISLPGHWVIHSYYTLIPWAPDDSGRLLVVGADLVSEMAKVFILSATGEVLDSFGENKVTPSFWHTGFWQSWSPDCRYVYFQSGTLQDPYVIRRELATGTEVKVKGDLEGIPASGEPAISCNHGMLYAAGYSSNVYKPEDAVVPFQDRDKHGIYQMSFEPAGETLVKSVNDILAIHPEREKILAADAEICSRLGQGEGLTLMTYCVRWNAQGDRFLFYFGNHCVALDRKEPKITYVFTSNRDFTDIHLAVDCSFNKRGVHWGWHPDGTQLIGYGPKACDEAQVALSLVNYDGTNYRNVSEHDSWGHPTLCPIEPRLAVTDESSLTGRIVFIDIENDVEVAELSPGRVNGEQEPAGRNPYRVCHHPVFSADGKSVLMNTMQGELAQVAIADVGAVIEGLRSGAHLEGRT